jgi:peroxiredoxin
MLVPNTQAPDFTSTNQHDQPIRLADFRGDKHVMLYFYPKDDTPGCTIEANQFTALATEFAQLDCVVIGVSRDACASHRAFIDKYGLRLDLLSDSDGALCQLYDVWREKEKNGVKSMGIVRSTFLIDKQGQLREVLYGVTADGHAAAMLEKVRQLQG